MGMDNLSHGGYAVIALATIFFALVLRQFLGGKDTGVKLPPGPWNLPIIGSLHHLANTTLAHRALYRLSLRHGPLMFLRLGEVPTVIASSSEAAMEVLKTKDLSCANRPSAPTVDVVFSGDKGLIFAPYGEHWRQMRKVCVMEVLSTRQVRRIDFIKEDEVASLVASFAAAASSAAPVDISQTLAELVSNIIARATFGSKCPQQEVLLREFHAVTLLLGGFSVEDLFPSSGLVRWLSGSARNIRRSAARVQRILAEIIAEREEKKSTSGGVATARDDEDLLDVLLRLRDEGTLAYPLTTENVSAVILDIFGGSLHSTSALLEWSMSELIRHPNVMARVQLEVRQRVGQGRSAVTSAEVGDLRYLRTVIKETLRLHPGGALIPRASKEDCQVMGYDIPKGTHVLVNGFATGMDTRQWGEDAAEFRPERFEENGRSSVDYAPGAQMEFLAFGAGRRSCPGALFATTTVELVLANLLYRFDWTMPGGANPDKLDMSEAFGMILCRKSNLWLQPVISLTNSS